MDRLKLQSYLGFCFIAPIILVFFVSEYSGKIFALNPAETKVHEIIQNTIEALFHLKPWYSSASEKALYGWWFLLGVAILLVWKYRAKLGALLVRAANVFHAKV